MGSPDAQPRAGWAPTERWAGDGGVSRGVSCRRHEVGEPESRSVNVGAEEARVCERGTDGGRKRAQVRAETKGLNLLIFWVNPPEEPRVPLSVCYRGLDSRR